MTLPVTSTLKKMSCHNTTPRIAVLLYSFLAACHMAQADYRIFLNLRSFSNPNNSIANGACCDQSSCQQPCNIMLRFCFQDSGHSSGDLEGSCALAQFNRTNAGTTIADLPMGSAITGPYPTDAYYILPGIICQGNGITNMTSPKNDALVLECLQGQFQVYIRVSHRNSDAAPNFTPPFTDDLIDNIIIETNLASHSFEDRGSNNLQVEVHEQSGGRAVINLGLAVYCAENFFGPDCNCQDTNDTSGHFTCDQNGIKTCNDGYTDPATNCTQCIPEDGCSITGGFCVPGECRCIDGYSGENCDIQATTDTATTDTATTDTATMDTATTSTSDTPTAATGGISSTEDNSVAIIAGSVAGGAAALILIVVIIVLLVAFVLARRKRRHGKWIPKGYEPTGLQQYPTTSNSLTSEESDVNLNVPLYATIQKPKKNLYDEAPPIPPFQGDNIMYSVTGDEIRIEKRKEGVVFENAGVSGDTVDDSEEPQEYEEVRFNGKPEKGVSYVDLELPKNSSGPGRKISDVTYSEVEY